MWCSLAAIAWIWSQVQYEMGLNPILRFLCCSCFTVGRCLSCCCLKRLQKKQEKQAEAFKLRVLKACREKDPSLAKAKLHPSYDAYCLAQWKGDEKDFSENEAAATFAFLEWYKKKEEEEGC